MDQPTIARCLHGHYNKFLQNTSVLLKLKTKEVVARGKKEEKMNNDLESEMEPG